MSYHNLSRRAITITNVTPTATASNILTTIDGVPLFRTIQDALQYGQDNGLAGYHEHTFQGVVGYMAGFDHTSASLVTRTQVETTEIIQRSINSFSISDKKLTAVSEIREFSINGDVGSRFILYIIQKSSSSSVFEKYYNFITNTFETPTLGFNKNYYLRKELNSKVFNSKIHFPSGTSGGYKIVLIADPDSTTSLASSLNNANVFTKDIEDIANTTITFVFKTANTNSYASNPPSPNLTVTAAPAIVQQSKAKVNISKTLTNTNSDANGFGLRVTSVFNVETGFYCEKTHTVNGAVSSSKTIVLDSVDNLIVGATITGVDSGSVSGTPVIDTIDTDTNTITLTGNNQSFSDNATLTFRITGKTGIENGFGLELNESGLTDITKQFNQLTARAIAIGDLSLPNILSVSKTIRGSVSQDAGTSGGLNLNGTYGIAGGDHVAIFGNGFRNNTTVTSVNTPSSSAGSVTTNVGHSDLVTGETLTFVGSAQTLTFTRCELFVTSFPTEDLTVNIDLDSFITPGTAS